MAENIIKILDFIDELYVALQEFIHQNTLDSSLFEITKRGGELLVECR